MGVENTDRKRYYTEERVGRMPHPALKEKEDLLDRNSGTGAINGRRGTLRDHRNRKRNIVAGLYIAWNCEGN
jgi:hypothetical protein